MSELEIYTYFRSSAAFRVRIALNFKGLAARPHFVSLRERAHLSDDFASVNPQRLVPALRVGDEVLTQSLAIMDYLDEAYPDTPPLVWGNAIVRAHIRSLALSIVCEIHPLNNLRVLDYLRGPLGQGDAAVDAWARHWMALGFEAFEQSLKHASGNSQAGRHCVGDTISLADVVLVPQVFNAQRFSLEMAPYPELMKRFEAAMAQEAFKAAQPSLQADA